VVNGWEFTLSLCRVPTILSPVPLQNGRHHRSSVVLLPRRTLPPFFLSPLSPIPPFFLPPPPLLSATPPLILDAALTVAKFTTQVPSPYIPYPRLGRVRPVGPSPRSATQPWNRFTSTPAARVAPAAEAEGQHSSRGAAQQPRGRGEGSSSVRQAHPFSWFPTHPPTGALKPPHLHHGRGANTRPFCTRHHELPATR